MEMLGGLRNSPRKDSAEPHNTDLLKGREVEKDVVHGRYSEGWNSLCTTCFEAVLWRLLTDEDVGREELVGALPSQSTSDN